MERTVKLAMMLKLPVKIIEKLRNTIEWAIDRARSLLYDRHLDNTVLCVLYVHFQHILSHFHPSLTSSNITGTVLRKS